jgi:nucleotide-binding universal stress UspA family protein
MKTIIVPTDFSPAAINAMHYALRMAEVINAGVMLLHVYQVPVSYNNSDIPLPLMDISELEKINEERLQELRELAERTSPGALQISAQVKLGDLADELESMCADIQPFAVVMGTKGSGFVERLLVGSATLSVIRRLTWPVLVVPPGTVFKGIQKIGFACDLKKVVKTTPAHYVKEWVKTFGASMSILNVDDKKNAATGNTEAQSALLHTMLEEIHPEYFFIDNPDVEKGIHEFAENNNLDLLIVIPRKHRLLDSLFQKSHTKELAFHSHIPILAIHEEE